MNKKIRKILVVQLKVVAVGCFAMMAFLLASSFRAENTLVDFWKQLGISKEEADDNITESLFRGYLLNYSVNVKNIVSVDRAAVTKDMLIYCKKHVGTETFNQQYIEYRKRIKPIAPAIRTKDQIRQELVSNYEEDLKNYQNSLNVALVLRDEEMKNSAEKALTKCRKSLEEVNSGTGKLLSEQLIYADMRYKSEMGRYQSQICQWEQNYPPGSSQLVKRRLEYFLQTTKDINFNATLKEVRGKKIFVDPYYERKPAEWKMGFRAGKEVVQTARSFASDWIKELQ